MPDINGFIDKMVALHKPLICFRADGCMAHDHVFQWIGTMESFYKQGQDNIELVRVKIIKRADDPHNWPDKDLGHEEALVNYIVRKTDYLYLVYV